jgi:hypothetical protein
MKIIKYIALLLITLTQVSCFEIVEQINLKNDGSGTFKYTLNFSQSASHIKSILLMDEVEGYKVPTLNTIKSKFNKLGQKTTTVNGITDVKTESNFNDYIFTYACHFDKIEQLNAVIDTLGKTSENGESTNYFSYTKKDMVFTRLGDDLLKNHYDKLPEKQKVVFNGATFTSVYKFEGEILKQTHSKALVSANKKAILHKTDVIYLIRNGKIINKKVYLKK